MAINTSKMFNRVPVLVLFSMWQFGCSPTNQSTEKQLKNYIQVEDLKTQETLQAMDNNVFKLKENTVKLSENLSAEAEGPDLFSGYLNKNILDQPVASKYNLNEIPGYIYKKNDNGTFSRVSKRFVKENAEIVVQKVDQIYFSDIISNEKKFEVAIAFLGLNIEKGSKSELIIKDEITTIIPDEVIHYEFLKEANRILADKNQYDRYYFVTGATLSSVSYKLYTEQKFKKSLDQSWLTIGGNVYGSQESYRYQNQVALEMIKLADLVF